MKKIITHEEKITDEIVSEALIAAAMNTPHPGDALRRLEHFFQNGDTQNVSDAAARIKSLFVDSKEK